MYKSILVHVDTDDVGCAARIQTALHLARECHATLIGVAAALPLAMIEIYSAGATALAAGMTTGDPDEMQARFAASRAEFERWTADGGIETEWRTAIDFAAHAIAEVSGRADLIVVGSSRGRPANSYLDTADVIMRAGRPVLVVPHTVSRLDCGNAVIAWRNTRECRRALADALPLLAVYRETTLLHVKEGGEDNDPSIDDARAFLDGHSISAAVQVIESGHAPAGEAIAGFAARAQASLIVAGAYGHSRLREWVLGGVTSELIPEMPVARLFSR